MIGMAKKVKCPKCKSLNVQLMGQDRKGFSVGKAIGGALITGATGGLGGALAGFIGKKGKYDMFCSDCGSRFQVK